MRRCPVRATLPTMARNGFDELATMSLTESQNGVPTAALLLSVLFERLSLRKIRPFVQARSDELDQQRPGGCAGLACTAVINPDNRHFKFDQYGRPTTG
jgi:hypothetical protein